MSEHCTTDCSYQVSGCYQKGRTEISKFYTERAERLRAQRDGVRTQCHSITNLRVALKDKDHATVRFLVVNYSAEGKPPAMDSKGPTIVTDSHMQCRHDSDRAWRHRTVRQ